jgi:hypothetical protein
LPIHHDETCDGKIATHLIGNWVIHESAEPFKRDQFKRTLLKEEKSKHNINTKVTTSSDVSQYTSVDVNRWTVSDLFSFIVSILFARRRLRTVHYLLQTDVKTDFLSRSLLDRIEDMKSLAYLLP